MPRGDRGGTSKGSGVRCVASGCGKTHADGVSLHMFPKDSSLRRQWADFVKTKRAKWSGPTEYSALCSYHFTADCYPFRHRFEMEQMGRAPKKAKLNEDAVPTIHSVNSGTEEERASDSMVHIASDVTTTPKHRLPKLEMLSPSEISTSQSSPPKKLRRGYAKREAARVNLQYLQYYIALSSICSCYSNIAYDFKCCKKHDLAANFFLTICHIL